MTGPLQAEIRSQRQASRFVSAAVPEVDGWRSTLTSLLTDRVPSLTRLCTPSILLEQEYVLDILRSDVGVSFSEPGTLIGHTGMFASTSELVARIHGAEEALLVTNGSTGANQVALAAIARVMPKGLFLVDRQCHHSVPAALTAFGLDWAYMRTGAWAPRWEVAGPVTAADVADAIVAAPSAVGCVVVTSPTYSGECGDLAGVVDAVRRLAPAALVHVDAAWMAHAPWIEQLRGLTAMAAGADTASISLHKQAGSLQPGAALLAHTRRLPVDALHAAYAELASTSQSLLIAASIDASQRYLSDHGDRCFERVVEHARRLKHLLLGSLPDPVFLDDECPGPHDPTKLTLSLDPYGTGGYAFAAALERVGIVAEKASPRTITFLTTLSTTAEDVARAAQATARLLREAGPGARRRTGLSDPFELSDAMPALKPTAVVRGGRSDGRIVAADEAVGKVSAERIEAYPPGTAIIFEGFRISARALDWLRSVREAGGSISARDPSLRTIRVIG